MCTCVCFVLFLMRGDDGLELILNVTEEKHILEQQK